MRTIINNQIVLDGEKMNEYICMCCGDIVSSLRAYGDYIEVCSECEDDLDEQTTDIEIEKVYNGYLAVFENDHCVEFKTKEDVMEFQNEWRRNKHLL